MGDTGNKCVGAPERHMCACREEWRHAVAFEIPCIRGINPRCTAYHGEKEGERAEGFRGHMTRRFAMRPFEFTAPVSLMRRISGKYRMKRSRRNVLARRRCFTSQALQFHWIFPGETKRKKNRFSPFNVSVAERLWTTTASYKSRANVFDGRHGYLEWSTFRNNVYTIFTRASSLTLVTRPSISFWRLWGNYGR